MSNLKVKTILVSQPEPKVDNSPYHDLQNKFKVKIDFRPFIHIEGVSAKEVRAQKIDLNNLFLLNTRKKRKNNFFAEDAKTCESEKIDN